MGSTTIYCGGSIATKIITREYFDGQSAVFWGTTSKIEDLHKQYAVGHLAATMMFESLCLLAEAL